MGVEDLNLLSNANQEHDPNIRAKRVNVIDSSGNSNSAVYPSSTDGDFFYFKDIDVPNSELNTFTTSDPEKEGFEALKTDLSQGIRDTTANNPKIVTIRLLNVAAANFIGFGCSKAGEGFSNLKLELLGSEDTVLFTIDKSTDDTIRNSDILEFDEIQFFTALRLTFVTANPICLTNVTFQKTLTVNSIQNLSKNPLNHHFVNFDSAITSLNTSAIAGDTSLSVLDTTGFSVGDSISITEGTLEETDDVEITAIAAGTPGTLTLDRPLDNSYTTSTIVERVLTNMAVIGTLSSPVSFRIKPPIDEIWKVDRIVLNLTHTGSGDDSRFGDIAGGLTNGVVLRQNLSAGTSIISNWKDNGDMAEDMYDLAYTSKAGGGLNGTRGRFTFNKFRFNVVLDGSKGDFLELLMQDNISSLNKMSVKAQGFRIVN